MQSLQYLICCVIGAGLFSIWRQELDAYEWEEEMARKYIDCREFPSDMRCTVAISADSDDELVEAATQHAVSVHHEHDTPEFRAEIRRAIHEGTPPLTVA
jgi:predicted small metal-binding protein